MTMKSWLLAAGVVGLLLLHQDTWFWDVARPLVGGFLPVGLFYHAVYTLMVSAFMVILIRYAWPTALERQAERDPGDET